MTYDIEALRKKLKKELDHKRYRHTLGVMYTAASLAMAHGEDMHAAGVAGLLHDCAKCIPDKQKIKMCRERGMELSAYELENPFMLHARLGAVLAREIYGVTEEGILSAITWHTTGKPDMTRLEKIIFIADFIEPWRDQAKNLAEVRPLAFKDLDECMYVICRDTLTYLKEKGAQIDDMTAAACQYYQKLKES